MSKYIVYADILLALNFFCDFVLLWTSGRILRRKTSLPRITAAAALGALYGLTAISPALNWMTHPFCLFVISLLLLRAAYEWDCPLSFLKLTGSFYLCSFTLAGAALAGERLLENNGIILAPTETFKAGSLLFAIFLGAILGRRGFRMLRRNWQKEDFRMRIQISANGKRCILPALIDTGNDLAEPLSGLPVIVASYAALKPLFPAEVSHAIERYAEVDPALIIKSMENATTRNWRNRLRLIPFSSVGKSNGLLPGFRPDELVIMGREKRHTDQVIIGITMQELGNGYQAVINPEVLAGGEKHREVSCA